MTVDEFVDLLDRNQVRLGRVAAAMLRNWHDVEDVVQEAVWAGLSNRNQLRGGKGAFPFWMQRIVARECGRVLRHRGRVLPVADHDGDQRDLAATVAKEDLVDLLACLDPGLHPMVQSRYLPAYDAAARAIVESVLRLDDRFRQVVVLRYLCDMSQAEVAAALQVPVGTVKSRLNKALALLRQIAETPPGNMF